MLMGDLRSREPACQMFPVGTPLAVTVGGECLASSSDDAGRMVAMLVHRGTGPSSLLVLLVASSSLGARGWGGRYDPQGRPIRHLCVRGWGS